MPEPPGGTGSAATTPSTRPPSAVLLVVAALVVAVVAGGSVYLFARRGQRRRRGDRPHRHGHGDGVHPTSSRVADHRAHPADRAHADGHTDAHTDGHTDGHAYGRVQADADRRPCRGRRGRDGSRAGPRPDSPDCGIDTLALFGAIDDGRLLDVRLQPLQLEDEVASGELCGMVRRLPQHQLRVGRPDGVTATDGDVLTAHVRFRSHQRR